MIVKNTHGYKPFSKFYVISGALIVAMLALGFGTDYHRDQVSRAWWASHSAPLVSSEPVTNIVEGQHTWKQGPYTAWVRAETPNFAVFTTFEAIGCETPEQKLVGPGMVSFDDIKAMEDLRGKTLAGLDLRTVRDPNPGEDAAPPCPGMSVRNGVWTQNGKVVLRLNAPR